METPCTPADSTGPAGPAAPGQAQALRIVDAAANRCREGVRVAEDFVRFRLGDRYLHELLKTWRHDFAQACRLLDAQALLAARDAARDVGAEVRTAAERARASPDDVARAAFKRVQEAARTLEEYGKLLSGEFAECMAGLRYRAYTLEKAVFTAAAACARLAGVRLCLLVTRDLCADGAESVVQGALEAGVRMVQVREKSLSDRELLAWTSQVRKWTADAGALCIVNDRPDIALVAGADGVHVGQDDLPAHAARRIVGPGKLVGVSTHTLAQAHAAVLDGADYIGVGPLFPSGTKPFETLPGLDLLQQVTAAVSLPAFAIGGIDAGNVAKAVAAGAKYVAVCGALCRASDPAGVARDLVSQLGKPREPEV